MADLLTRHERALWAESTLTSRERRYQARRRLRRARLGTGLGLLLGGVLGAVVIAWL